MRYKLVILFFLQSFLISVSTFAQVPADSTSADSALLKQVEEQMQAGATEQPIAAQPRSSLTFNPDIGVIGDFQSSFISRGKKNFDMYLNETEVSLQA
ncbi:MAG: hypothetical protein ABI472_21265, partial [Ginsengibacter sp.]